MENLYQILKCEETASYQILKKAFSELALKWHPDKVGQNAKQSSEIFNRISHAWKILGDPELRKEYDIRWKERCLAQTYPIQDTVDFKEFEYVQEHENETKITDDEHVYQHNVENVEKNIEKDSAKENDPLLSLEGSESNSEQVDRSNHVNVNKVNTDIAGSEGYSGQGVESSGWYIYSCRCGGEYVLTAADVQMKFDIVCCDSCTLTVQVLYDGENT